jgi:fatty-acyl-CoA synthase
MQKMTEKPAVEGKTYGQVLRETARQFPERDAAVFPQFNWRATWAQFDRQVDEVAQGLLSLGLRKGDHLALWCTNRPQWPLLQFASARIGVVLVTVNPAYRAHELEYALRQSDAKVVALIESFKTSQYFDILDSVCPELARSKPGSIAAESFPHLRWVISLSDTQRPGMIDFQELIERGRSVTAEQLAAAEAATAPTDKINIQYTSGTTGFPKGATLTHRNLLLNAWYCGLHMRFTEADRLCVTVPLYHCFGCVMGSTMSAVFGSAAVYPHEYFEPGKTLEAVEREKCTAIYGVPTMFIAQLEHPDFPKRDVSSLRTGIMAGSPCPLVLMQRVVKEMGASELCIAYGQTEASPIITMTRYDDPVEKRCGTVGRAIPGVEAKIVDAATGSDLPDGQQGELCARGHCVMIGYYNMPEKTAEAIDADRWLHTGDLAVRTADGFYRITGRLKDMIIRGGENIYPREVEEYLYKNAKIEDAQVFGVPDMKFGEQVAAWIKCKAGQSMTEQEVREYCRSGLAHYKTPHYIKFVDAFPMTVTGKIQKFKMREMAIEELGLEDAAKVETA